MNFFITYSPYPQACRARTAMIEAYTICLLLPPVAKLRFCNCFFNELTILSYISRLKA
jgi:hypothetical protein